MATAITAMFFFALALDVWRLRFHKKLGWFGYLLLGAAITRLILMVLPQND